jgi:hypothetical protein
VPDAKSLRQTNGGERFEHDFLQGKMHGGNIFNVRIVLKYDFVMTLGKRVQTRLELPVGLTAERESAPDQRTDAARIKRGGHSGQTRFE